MVTSYATGTQGQWVTGDFNTHTYLSNGSNTAAEVAAKAKAYGLDWYAASDNGGSAIGTKDQNGVAWTAGTAGLAANGAVPRWMSILGIGESEINKNRSNGALEISGFEWNVPGHDQASVGMIGNSDNVKSALAKFDYTYDSTAEATSTDTTVSSIDRTMDGKGAAAAIFTYTNHNGALAAAQSLQDNYSSTSYILPTHLSSKLTYTAADLREFNDIAPSVFFGAELLPGHQSSSYRGGYGYYSFYDTVSKKYYTYSMGGTVTYYQIDAATGKRVNTGTTAAPVYVKDATKGTGGVVTLTAISDIKDYVLYEAGYMNAETSTYNAATNASPTRDSVATINAAFATNGSFYQNVAKERTYGGADYMLAKVGGTWDSLLSEGRKFWVFGNSDYTSSTGSQPDFAPGEYSKNYTFASDKSYQGILDGMRSGNSYSVIGDLISGLDYKITNNSTSAVMGSTLTPVQGKDSTVTIRFKSPAKNNANSNGRTGLNETPLLDHIDLIAGTVTGVPAKYNSVVSNWTDNRQYLTAAYQSDSVSTTSVIKTFTKNDWKLDADGYYTVTFTLPATDKDMYYRLRGTNLAPNTAGQTDAQGNPLIDTAADSAVGTNSAQAAFSDLWFYSNPIFVNAAVDGATINGTLQDKAGNALKNMTVSLDGTTVSDVTSDNGTFSFNNLAVGIYNLVIKNSSGAVVSQLTFNASRNAKTTFTPFDIKLASNVSVAGVTFMLDGSTTIITNVYQASSPEATGDVDIKLIAFMAILISIVALAFVQTYKRYYMKSRKKISEV